MSLVVAAAPASAAPAPIVIDGNLGNPTGECTALGGMIGFDLTPITSIGNPPGSSAGVTVTGTPSSISWSSSTVVHAVFVKAGNGGHAYLYPTGAFSDSGLTSPMDSTSHMTFCTASNPPPTSTPVPTATSTPTSTPVPTATATPANTPVATATPIPTDTPVATATAIPANTPTAIPSPSATVVPGTTVQPAPSATAVQIVIPGLPTPTPTAEALGTTRTAGKAGGLALTGFGGIMLALGGLILIVVGSLSLAKRRSLQS